MDFSGLIQRLIIDNQKDMRDRYVDAVKMDILVLNVLKNRTLKKAGSFKQCVLQM